MRIVLDASALWHPSVVRAQARSRLQVILPTIALAERARHLRIRGEEPEELLRELRNLAIDVESFSKREATGFPSRVRDRQMWDHHARDAMIAGHLRPGDFLLTANERDFEDLGLDPARVIVVEEKPRVRAQRGSA